MGREAGLWGERLGSKDRAWVVGTLSKEEAGWGATEVGGCFVFRKQFRVYPGVSVQSACVSLAEGDRNSTGFSALCFKRPELEFNSFP